jgi:Glyoxalase-like domain
MTLQFDHAVIAVNDLQQAMADYRELGFNPFYGGEHVGGKTHNALIVFQDGTYLELLAPTSPALLYSLDPDDHANFLFLFAGGEGLVAYALRSDDLEADVTAMQARKVAVTLRLPTGRARPDGQQLQWQSAILDNGSMNPFFIQDITPRSLRVPDDPAATTQPNGAIGVAIIEITFGLEDSFKMHRKSYAAILGADPDTYEKLRFSILGDYKEHLPIGERCHLKLVEREGFRFGLRNPNVPNAIELWTNKERNVHTILDKSLSHNAEIILHGSK